MHYTRIGYLFQFLSRKRNKSIDFLFRVRYILIVLVSGTKERGENMFELDLEMIAKLRERRARKILL